MIVDGNTYCKVISYGSVLPTEYQEVEYIESTGTQWIDTNATLKQNSSFDVRFYEVNIPNPATAANRTHIIGFHDGSNRFRIRRIEQDIFYFLYGNSGLSWIPGGGISMKNRLIDFHYSINEFTASRDGTTYTYTPSQFTFVQSNRTIKLFNEPSVTGEQIFEGRFYFFKLKEGDTLVRNMIPCYRKSDNEIGMYDTVNKVFYTNQGTGTFLKGNNVVHTIRYKIPTEERPYISGHVTDESSIFTFTVNGNQSVTVPVDSNGNWKWVVDRTITSLNQAFNTKLNISEVNLNSLKDVTDMTQIFRAGSAETALTKVEFKNCDFSKVTSLNSAFNNRRGLVSVKGIDSSKFELNTNLMYAFIYCYKLQFPENFKWSNIVTNKISDMRYVFADCRTIINESTYYGGTIDCSNATPTKLDCAYMNCFVDKIILPIITSTCTVTNAFDGALRLVDIEAQSISTSLDLRKCSRLNKQSIINLVNAAEASITYTLHATPYAKCASGGEWYTDIQAAIDAKAQQGYTVTLISA